MLIRELLTEASYDSMVDSLRRKFPEQDQMIRDQVRWAKQALKRADRITWYLRVIQAYLDGVLDDPKITGDYPFSNIERLQQDIIHFFGFNYAPIEQYQFGRQTISQVITDLTAMEIEWRRKNEKNKGVEPQEGDYKILEFAGGYAWWWVNRAYCPEEGRSGSHCGNVTGQERTDQRILSFRTANNNVLLTFILEPDGTLGEMKAKNNQKPAVKLHQYIVKLLDLDMIKGISENEGQYAPHNNFNMFDLSEDQLNYFLQKKPGLIETQIKATPMSILSAPTSIRNNLKLQEIAVNERPGLKTLLKSKVSNQTWEQAVDDDPALIIYAPIDIPGFEDKLIDYMKYDVYSEDAGGVIAHAPPSISRNYDLLKKIIEFGNANAVFGVSPNLKGYQELCELAVEADIGIFYNLSDENKTEDMCKTAVMHDGLQLAFVPDKLKSDQVCMIAVNNTGEALEFVPDNLKEKIQQKFKGYYKVLEPGLTPLTRAQILSQKQYADTVNEYGDDTFTVGKIQYKIINPGLTPFFAGELITQEEYDSDQLNQLAVAKL